MRIVLDRRRSDCAPLAAREPPSRQQGAEPARDVATRSTRRAQCRKKSGQPCSREPEHKPRVHHVVPVGEHVPEVDDAPGLRYPRSHFRKVAREPCDGFPDNLERSLDRPLRSEVLDELAFRHVAEQCDDVLRGAARILNDGLRVTPHRAAPRRVAGIRGGGGF